MTRHQYNNDKQLWNFGARFSDVIWRGNQWLRRQMSAVFSVFVNGYITSYVWLSLDSSRNFFDQNKKN